MKIIKLSAENVKRLVSVEITPKGNVVVLGGKNGAGKSSCLDALEWAIGGDPKAKMPVRRGEEKARIVVDLGDIVIHRRFTAVGGTSLTITNADGVKQTSPQTILDKLFSKIAFDPLQFSRSKPKEQAEILRSIVGVDFSVKDAERQKAFDERTVVNREITSLQSRLAVVPKHEDVPLVEESVGEILEEQKKASESNASNRALREKVAVVKQQLADAEEAITDYEGLCKEAEKEIERWKKVLAERKNGLADAKKQLPAVQAALKESQETVAKFQDIDLGQFRERVARVEQTNRMVRENKARAELVQQLKAKTTESDKLTDRLDKIDSEKRKAAMDAKYPIEGLAFDTAGGVTFNGIPFDQCSSAEQLKVSVAIGMALNPRLRVLLIRDGSLLDDANMKVLADMAKDGDYQIWIEQCRVDGNTSVVIEDGKATPTHLEQPNEEARLL